MLLRSRCQRCGRRGVVCGYRIWLCRCNVSQVSSPTFDSLSRRLRFAVWPWHLRHLFCCLPVVLDVVCGHGRIGHPVVNDGIDAHRDGVSGEDLKEEEEATGRRQNCTRRQSQQQQLRQVHSRCILFPSSKCSFMLSTQKDIKMRARFFHSDVSDKLAQELTFELGRNLGNDHPPLTPEKREVKMARYGLRTMIMDNLKSYALGDEIFKLSCNVQLKLAVVESLANAISLLEEG